MLKGISPLLSPELLKILNEMGHGDELVIADGNFPGASVGQRCVRLDGHGGVEIMKAIVALFPLDDFVEKPIAPAIKPPSGRTTSPLPRPICPPRPSTSWSTRPSSTARARPTAWCRAARAPCTPTSSCEKAW